MPTRIDYDDLDQIKIKALFYGLPGSGKTWLAASACHVYNTLMLTAAGNPQSLRDWTEHPDTFTINELEDLNPFYEFFKQGQPKDAGMVKNLGLAPPYECLIIDGLTELQRFTLSQVGGYDKLGPGKRGNQLQIQQFNPVLEHTIRMASLFFGLADPGAMVPVHVIITSLEWNKLDLKSQTQSILPLIWGSANTEVAGYALAVGRIRQGSAVPKKIMRTMPEATTDSPVIAFKPQPRVPLNKDQYGGRLGDYLADPTIVKMAAQIYDGKTGTKQTEIKEEENTNE